VPAELLDRAADFGTLGALERRHSVGLVDQFRIEVQPVGRGVLKRRLLAAVHDALVTFQTCNVAEALATVLTRLTWRHNPVFLSKHL